MRLLFLGDVVGQGGCEFLMRALPDFKRKNNIDVCIANGENSAQGNGVTPKSCDMIFSSGVDFITLGNHTFKRPEIMEYLDKNVPVIRPYNFPDGAPGRGVGVIDKGRFRVAVINMQGTVYMEPLGNPFWKTDKALMEIEGCKTVIMDFHAEAPAEKRAMGFYLDGKVTAVLGTHTHVQTADARVLPSGTAYITDAGMCGADASVLGREIPAVLEKFTIGLPNRLPVVEKGLFRVDGAAVSYDHLTGKALKITPFSRFVEI